MTTPNADQRALWNALSGPRWVALQPLMDRQLAVFTHLLASRLAPAPGERGLDVGCGCGDSALALARAVSPGGNVNGVDISVPMLDLARARAAEAGIGNAVFAVCDAQVDALPGAPYDFIASRFGVMFFDDPAAAFAHLGAALVPGGRLAFVCWQAPEENPWVTVPREAAASVLGEVKLAPPRAPGPFAFAEERWVREVLGGAGFVDVAVEGVRTSLAMGGGGDLDEVTGFLLQMGPTASALRDATEDQVSRVRAALRAALAPHVGDDGVRLDGAVWLVTARRPR